MLKSTEKCKKGWKVHKIATTKNYVKNDRFNGNSTTIRNGQESQCLPYGGFIFFFFLLLPAFGIYFGL